MRFAGCLFLGVFLFSFSALAKSGVDPADEIDQQMAFVDSAMRSIEKQRSEMDSEKKDEEIHRRALEKKRTEARLAVQLQGLSGTLSGLPEMPNFNGKFDAEEKPAQDSPEKA